MQVKYRFLDRKGRLTIPKDFRSKLKLNSETIFCFEEEEDGTLMIRQQKIGLQTGDYVIQKRTSLLDFINGLNPSEQRAVFKHLARTLAELEET